MAQIPASRLDSVAAAFGDFADLKSPFTLGHSSGVARLAEAAAQILVLPDERAFDLRNAGLLHDLARVSVSNGIWDKPHTAYIYEKTGLSNRAGVALFSIENDLIHN
jgi:HD-GYP domain-containing protein (c-di-GMP phosphodiesterase class II)